MTDKRLSDLIASEEALIKALDGDDAGAIETALPLFARAIDAARGAGAWRDTTDLRAHLTRALALAEAARVRTNYLADRTRRQLDRLAAFGRGRAKLAYGRDGRFKG